MRRALSQVQFHVRCGGGVPIEKAEAVGVSNERHGFLFVIDRRVAGEPVNGRGLFRGLV